MNAYRSACVDCSIEAGHHHLDDCGQARCQATGLRWLDCPCPTDSFVHVIDIYAGWFGMEVDARALGWFVRWDGERWVRCTPDEPDSGPDISRLIEQGAWNVEEQRWEKRKAVLYARASTDEKDALDAGVTVPVVGQFEELREWADEEGYSVQDECVDYGRIGRGFRSVLSMLGEGEAEVVLVIDQRHLGATGKTRHGSVEKIKAAGGNLRSKSLWWSGLTPATYKERARAAAKAAMPTAQLEEQG